MTQAIRIEHEDGYGIFVSWNNKHEYRSHCIADIHDNIRIKHCDTFNTPQADGLSIHKNLYCAYHSIIQLQQYLSIEEIQFILSYNYKIYVLLLCKCQIGKHNIVFNKKHIINKIDITKLFKE